MNSVDQNSLISVVVTTYNGEKFLAEQLDSIINQTHKNLEIIICDDASSDRTAEIIKQYSARDNRINPIFHQKNIGLHANLESGLKIARGNYIAISDQDDIWKIEKIDLLLRNIGTNLAIFSDSALIDEKGRALDKTILSRVKIKHRNSCYKLLALLGKNVVSGHALLFRRQLLTAVLPFGENLIFDHHLALVASAFDGLAFYPASLVLHRIHSANSTNSGLVNKHQDKRRSQISDKLQRTARLLEKFSFLYLLNQSELTSIERDHLNSHRVLFEKLELLICELEKFDDIFFNFSLFIQLLQLHQHYPEYDIFKFWRCFTLAKGAKWYRFFDHFYPVKPATFITPADKKPENYYSHLRPRMMAYLPTRAKTCLDVGCGIGQFGQRLKEGSPHLEVWGIEIVPAVAEQAKNKLDRVLVGDVTSLIDQLPDGYFDCIFFNDSLEHMVDPYSVLTAIRSKLKQPSGVVVASIPNIRHFSCLYNLLIKKDWRYVESGVMDSTHLRFFTEKSIRRMFEETNYKIQLLDGLSGSRKLRAKIWGWLTFSWMNDIRFKQFAVVASSIK